MNRDILKGTPVAHMYLLFCHITQKKKLHYTSLDDGSLLNFKLMAIKFTHKQPQRREEFHLWQNSRLHNQQLVD
jgi:hypothetical protein